VEPLPKKPKLAVGEVDVLPVVDVTPFGAFVDWGQDKDLLVPLKEQTRPMRVGEKYAVGLYVDRTSRLAGTMRVAEMLRADRDLSRGEWVPGVAWRDEPGLGLFVIVERRSLALLPATEPHALRVGDAASFRVTHVHADGKVEVSLRRPKEDEIDEDAERLFAVLAGPRPPALGDASSPERIRALVGISKKAFKRAAGRLLKTGRVVVGDAGFLRARKGPG
jgi:predicted RNA-binding protein (virulence factor B family)